MLAHNTRTRKLVAAVVAAVAVVAAGLSAPTPAQAQSGNVVTFGDSYTSSPDEWLNGMLASPLPTPPPPAVFCAVHDQSSTSRPVLSASCRGQLYGDCRQPAVIG